MPKSESIGSNTAKKGSSLITMEDKNGWVLIQLQNCPTNIEETRNEAMQTLLSDYVVVTLEEVNKCGEHESTTKAKKVKPFLKIPTKRFIMSHPRYFVPKLSNKTGKVKTHCLSIQRLKPYLRTRFNHHHDKLQNASSSGHHQNYQETLSTIQKSLSVFYGASENKESKISTFALKRAQPRAVEGAEKRSPECSLTLNDLYFASTCCKIKILLGVKGNDSSCDSGMVLPHKLFIRGKAEKVGLFPRSHFEPFVKNVQIPRQNTYSKERKMKMYEDRLSSLPFLTANDHGVPLKSSYNGLNIYGDIQKALESTRSYYTRVFLDEATAGNHHDNSSIFKFVRKDSATVGEDTSPVVINVIVDKLTLANIMEKENARDRFDGKRIASTYGCVGPSFVLTDDEAGSPICLKAVSVITKTCEDFVKAPRSTCVGNTAAAVMLRPSDMKTVDDQVFLSRLPFLTEEVQRPKSNFSILSRPKPLFFYLKGYNQMTVMNKGKVWYNKMIASAFSCLPQHLTMLSQLPGPSVLFWLLGCHILSVLSLHPGLCSSTTETQTSSNKKRPSFCTSPSRSSNPLIVRILRPPALHSEPVFAKLMSKRALAAQKTASRQRRNKGRPLGDMHGVKCPLLRNYGKGNKKNALMQGKFNVRVGKRAC